MYFNQDDSQISDTSQTTDATFQPELMKWLIFSYLQLETNQPINHFVHHHVAESRVFPHSVEPECSLLFLQDRSFLRITQFIIVLHCCAWHFKVVSLLLVFRSELCIHLSFPRRMQGFASLITEFIVIFGKNNKL